MYTNMQYEGEDTPNDTTLPIAVRKPSRPRILPKRYRDVLPEPPPTFLPPQNALSEPPPTFLPPQDASPIPPSQLNLQLIQASLPSERRASFSTSKNVFGLWRRYFNETAPYYTPEEGLADLVDGDDCYDDVDNRNRVVCTTSPCASPFPVVERQNTDFYPYPNRSSFLLGDWFWNGGFQKSQKNFSRLVDIINDPRFLPDDVKVANWRRINHLLAGDLGSDGTEEWEDVDIEGWQETPVTMSVPFHARCQTPGPQNYTVKFHHRSITSVIREKLTNPIDARRFVYEPYEIYWDPLRRNGGVQKVHGELFTSSAFLESHRDLQSLSLTCDLPRVVVALMFSSDVTHLSMFSNAKLWPLYMFFGNESKYRRSKPSCRLCCHVAFFEKVRSTMQMSIPHADSVSSFRR